MRAEPELVGPKAFEEFPFGQLPAREVGTAGAARRHWRMIAGFAIIGPLCAYGVCQKLTPLYASKATVMIDPREPKRTEQMTDPMSFLPPSEEGVRKNEIAVIRSRKLAETVISDLKLEQDAEFNPALRPPSALRNVLNKGSAILAHLAMRVGRTAETPKTYGSPAERIRDRAVDLFLDHLGTTETEASRVIEIRFLSVNPQRAAMVANAVAAQYIQHKVKQDLSEGRTAIHALNVAIRNINNDIRVEEHTIEKMRSEQGGVPAADVKVISEQISNLNRELILAARDRAADEGRIVQLEAARNSQSVDSLASVLASPLIQRLQEEVAQLAAKLTSLTALYGSNYPSVIATRAQLNGLRGRIDGEITKIAASYISDLAGAQAKEKALRQMLALAQTQMAGAAKSDVDVRALEREVGAKKSVMAQLVGRLNDTPALTNRERPDAQVISTATMPLSPSYPPTLAIVAVAFLFFTTAGVILAVLLDRRDDSIRSTMQLRQMTTARILGWVPTLRRAGWAQSPPARVLEDRTSMFVENLRAVWFQIDHYKQAPAKTLLITSAVPGEGKSSIATSLARLLALSGRTVLLIDADLRHPGVHRALGLKQSPGLADVIEGTKTLRGVLQVDSASGASVIAAGDTPASPADLLQSPRMSQAMAHLSAEYDAIIIDTPPVLAVHDVGILAPQVDMTVMVVRSGTRATTFMTALQRLHDLNVPLSGVILSMVDRKASTSAYSDADTPSDLMWKYHSG